MAAYSSACASWCYRTRSTRPASDRWVLLQVWLSPRRWRVYAGDIVGSHAKVYTWGAILSATSAPVRLSAYRVRHMNGAARGKAPAHPRRKSDPITFEFPAGTNLCGAILGFSIYSQQDQVRWLEENYQAIICHQYTIVHERFSFSKERPKEGYLLVQHCCSERQSTGDGHDIREGTFKLFTH